MNIGRHNVTNHPLIQNISITRVVPSRAGDAHSVGDTYEGWLNEGRTASDYFTLKYNPAAGWMANLGVTWRKKINNDTIPQLLGLEKPV